MSTVINAKVRHKRGTEASIPSLMDGQIYLCTDKDQIYKGTSTGNKKLYDRSEITSKSELVSTPQKTIANITYYVDSINGIDTNDGTVGTPFKTIQKAINMLPQIINHSVTINVVAGTYAETVNINGFVGLGNINLFGSSDLTNAVNYKVNAVYVFKSTCTVSVRGFQMIGTTGITAGMYVVGSTYVTFQYCSDVVVSARAGVDVTHGMMNVMDSQISNKAQGILGYIDGTVRSINNSGSTNTTACQVVSGVIMKDGLQPTGGTDVVIGGGAIR